MATTTEAFNDTKIDVTHGVFIAKSDRAHQYVNDLRNGHLIVDIEEFGISIVHTGQILAEPPHQLSQSDYQGRMLLPPDKILFYTLAPDRESSAHGHQTTPHPMSERYFGIGLSYLYTEDEGWKTLRGSFSEPVYAWVNPGSKHYVMTLDKKAFNVVTMRNAMHYPENQQHIPVEDQRAFKDAARARLLPVPVR